MKYLTGYVVEKSLSVDNIFVIAMLFGFFAVPDIYQHRVLFWGIIGALAMRAVMIVVGAALIAQFHWILYVFGGFLILTGLKMFFIQSEGSDPQPEHRHQGHPEILSRHVPLPRRAFHRQGGHGRFAGGRVSRGGPRR